MEAEERGTEQYMSYCLNLNGGVVEWVRIQCWLFTLCDEGGGRERRHREGLGRMAEYGDKNKESCYFHTMDVDVAVTDWATSEMGPAGPTSAKSATLMKNATIFVAKRTKNWAKNGAWEARALHWCIDCTVHVVVAVMSTQEMDGVRSFGASNSFVEDLPQPVEGNMQEDTPESVRNSVIEPRVGMEFDSLQQVIEFYKHYAYSKGFATMTRNSRKKKGFSETSYVNLKCNREGRYSSSVDDPSKKRSTIKNACEAGIKASMDITDKKWRILSFIEDHNHDLSPSKSRHFAAFRHISTDTRRRLLINDNAGVRINSSIKASVVEAGGYENVTYNQRDVRNFLEKERRLKCKEGDGQALHDYFVRMQAKNSNFYHALDLDDELRVQNVFWVDARSRAAYESFNDVITFDTTYLTNKYDMPFAPFIGINHHGESIILGCGLLSSEDTDSFVWVFRQWLQSMCDIACSQKPLSRTNAKQCGGPYSCFRKLFIVGNFIVGWKSLKKNGIIPSLLHHLEENEWLAKLYEERERWVPAFLNSNFFAGMSSTQRSESMNAFFDGYLHSSTTLKVFVEQFEKAMRNKVEKEILSDFECFKGKLECSSSSPMEKQFQEAYTHEIFKRVRLEFAGRQGCIVNELVRGSDEVKYKIEDEACPGKLFEQRVTVLPDRYILDRWRKDIKRKHTYVSTCTDDVQHNPVLERYEKLHRLAVGVLEIGAESVENFNVLEKLLIDLKDNFSRSCDKQPSSQRKNSVGAAPDVVRTEVVRSPMVVKRKGRPRMKRLKSSMEEAVSKPKKKRNTAAARNLAHSTSTTGVGGSAYGDGSTSNMEYPVSMPHSNDGVIHLTNPMPSQSFVSESMSQTQAHGNEDQALNLT
uniref:Protein FAR1-RELATED SEQUENCE n=1 Tax=Fagus sylvatica TaxID=28930 RepID=A0A2N9HG60_FAGSY